MQSRYTALAVAGAGATEVLLQIFLGLTKTRRAISPFKALKSSRWYVCTPEAVRRAYSEFYLCRSEAYSVSACPSCRSSFLTG